MIVVQRRYHFESAHFLPKVPEGHRCKRMHGHNYEILVEIKLDGGAVDERGFVLDFYELDLIVHPLLGLIDHRCLNDVPGLENPTAELIGAWFLGKIGDGLPEGVLMHAVTVYETKDCCAIVTHRA